MPENKSAYAHLGARGMVMSAFVLAGVAALAPIIAAIFAAQTDAASLASFGASLVSAASIIALVGVLRPLLQIAANLERAVHGGEEVANADSAERMQANAQALLAKLSAPGGATIHARTGMATRDAFLNGVRTALDANPASGLLGILRVANFDRIAAFDASLAERLIECVAARLNGAVQSGRPIAQLDRDCFAVWIDGGPHQSGAELQALAYVLAEDIVEGDMTMTPDVQVGSALYPTDAAEAGNLLNRAFVSLARPQRTSEGAIAFFAQPAPQTLRRSFTLEQDLRRAVRRGAFALQYQPFVDLSAARVVGAEALLRFRSDNHPGLSAGEVIATLEQSGLIAEVGLWTLHTVCRQMRDWREAGLCDFKIAVNVSAQQLEDAGFVASVERTVAAHGLTPAMIELELTESATMADVARTHQLFERLREMGFSLAIDDFGSGYSSLTYLRRLPFQKLKIDREFVTHLDQRADSRTICKALIDLTAGLELSVLAEGVERFEEVEVLRALGCQTFQGFYFARPLDAGDFLAITSDPEWTAKMSSRVYREREELRRRLP